MLPEMSPREKVATFACGALLAWFVAVALGALLFVAFGGDLSIWWLAWRVS